jgi:hypothetical protein
MPVTLSVPDYLVAQLAPHRKAILRKTAEDFIEAQKDGNENAKSSMESQVKTLVLKIAADFKELGEPASKAREFAQSLVEQTIEGMEMNQSLQTAERGANWADSTGLTKTFKGLEK